VAGTTTHFVYDGNQVIAEYDGTGTLLRKFAYGPGIDQPVMMEQAGQRYFYHADALGSVVALTDGTGAIAETYRYEAFGEPEQASTLGNPYLFTGRRYDPETGTYYYRARYYDPELRRFLEPDPIGYVDGMNLYAYVGNSPVNFIDPSGKVVFIAAGAAIVLPPAIAAVGTYLASLGVKAAANASDVAVDPQMDAALVESMKAASLIHAGAYGASVAVPMLAMNSPILTNFAGKTYSYLLENPQTYTLGLEVIRGIAVEGPPANLPELIGYGIRRGTNFISDVFSEYIVPNFTQFRSPISIASDEGDELVSPK
jgi:RHS repeat-associated protein